jgi:hypothetical protein
MKEEICESFETENDQSEGTSGVSETTPTANLPLPLKTWHQNATHMGKFQSTYRESFKYNKK